MFIVNLSLGLLNGAPLIITDGGKVLNELMKKIPHGERISLILQGALVLLLVFSISLSFTPQ
jgi:membrane-associated protease RseP (regulator of RpoE activity)